MSNVTPIEWTDVTWNPVRGCSRVSEGCRNCYAEKIAARFAGPGGAFEGFAKVVAPRDSLDRVGGRRNGWTGKVELIPEKLSEPLRWRRPRRVFVNSMSDLFHESLPDHAIDRVFTTMAIAFRHTFQVLTKRPERMLNWFMRSSLVGASDGLVHAARGRWPLPNVWLGVSCEDQAAADERIPLLLQTPAAVRFVSAEPLIGPINFARVPGFNLSGSAGVELLRNFWIIVGGESGPRARPCDVAWIRSIVGQCRTAGVPVFVKQLGARAVVTDARSPLERAIREGGYMVRDRKGGDPSEWPEDLRMRQFPWFGS